MGIDPGRYTSEQGVSNKRSTTSRTTESFIANGYCGQFTSFDHESALSSKNIAHIDRNLVRLQAYVFYVDCDKYFINNACGAILVFPFSLAHLPIPIMVTH